MKCALEIDVPVGGHSCRVRGAVTPLPDGVEIRVVAIAQNGQWLPETWVSQLPTTTRMELENLLWNAFEEQERNAPLSRAHALALADDLERALAGSEAMTETEYGYARAFGTLTCAVADAITLLRRKPFYPSSEE